MSKTKNRLPSHFICYMFSALLVVSCAAILPSRNLLKRNVFLNDERFSESSSLCVHNLQNFTFYAMNMAFLRPCARMLRKTSLRVCMIEGNERRHLGPTLQDLRTSNQDSKLHLASIHFSAQYLTTPGDQKTRVWKNSVEKCGKHLGPTLNEIAQMKKDQRSSNKIERDRDNDTNDGSGPTKVIVPNLICFEISLTTLVILAQTQVDVLIKYGVERKDLPSTKVKQRGPASYPISDKYDSFFSPGPSNCAFTRAARNQTRLDFLVEQQVVYQL